MLPRGVHLLKRIAREKLSVDHYAVGIGAGVQPRFDPPSNVVLELGESGIRQLPYDATAGWIHVASSTDVEIALERLNRELTRSDGYRLSDRNCEHFARYVVLGREVSTQVQGVAVVVALLLVTGLAMRAGRSE